MNPRHFISLESIIIIAQYYIFVKGIFCHKMLDLFEKTTLGAVIIWVASEHYQALSVRGWKGSGASFPFPENKKAFSKYH